MDSSYGLTERSRQKKRRRLLPEQLNQRQIFLASYTSSITTGVSNVANESNKVMIAPGSYFTSVYENRPASFGVLPLPHLYLRQAIPMLAKAGAKSIQTVFEGGPGAQCKSIKELVKEEGMILQAENEFLEAPTKDDFLPVAKNMSKSEYNPDVVVTCTYDKACAEWIAALREVNWSPRAQVFSICIGLESFADAVGTDAEYLIGMSPWDRSLQIQDALTNWTPEAYASLFEAYSGINSAYHAALGQATVSVLAQAIEQANTLETDAISNVLSTQSFDTAFGKISFDENDQNKMDLIVTQYDLNGDVHVVYLFIHHS